MEALASPRQLWHARQKFVLNIVKSVAGCSRCGYGIPTALQFHHRDRARKNFNVGTSPNVANSRMVAELDKCDVLCANCHAEVEHGRAA